MRPEPRTGPGVSTYRLWLRLRDQAFTFLLANGFSEFGSGSIIQPPFRVYGEWRIRMGEGIFVGAGSWFEAIDEVPGNRSEITVGDDCSFAGSCVLSAVESISIGSRVLFARNVYVSDHNHRYDDPSRPVLDQGVDKVSPVVIGDGAWLGQNVVVTPGVTIGRGAVVAANSVVTRSVPDHTLVAGAPARVIRSFGPQERRAFDASS